MKYTARPSLLTRTACASRTHPPTHIHTHTHTHTYKPTHPQTYTPTHPHTHICADARISTSTRKRRAARYKDAYRVRCTEPLFNMPISGFAPFKADRKLYGSIRSMYLLKNSRRSQQLHCLRTVARERQIQRRFSVVVFRGGIRLCVGEEKPWQVSSPHWDNSPRTTRPQLVCAHAGAQTLTRPTQMQMTLASRRTRISGECLFMAAPISGVLPNKLEERGVRERHDAGGCWH